MNRIQTAAILKDLQQKMVFLAGPRQVGKTYLSKQIAPHFQHPVYLNYDLLEDRKMIETQAWLAKTDLIILDELHKMPAWKNYLKGLYDTKADRLKILVTGSARLDIYHQMGDSLAGRYFLHHLLPLSPAELSQLHIPYDIDSLLTQGGFPEPFLAPDNLSANRWRIQYTNSILSTDILEFDNIQNIKGIKLLFELLRTKVGTPVSYQSLAEDAAISPVTVKKYIQILEALYVVFLLTPFSNNIARSLLKEPKIYFFDTGLVTKNEGAQLENLVALCLLKHCYAKIDYHAEQYALHYLRTKDKAEVDFAVVKEGKIEQIIEVKTADSSVSKALYDFHQKYQLPAVQLVKALRQERMVGEIQVLRLENFLAQLFM